MSRIDLTFAAAGLIATTVGLAATRAAATPASGLEVLDTVILGESRHDSEKIGEFSALVANPDGSGILAISDRGYIAEFALDLGGDVIAGLELHAIHLLVGPDGEEMRDDDFDPEGAALLPDGNIAIVSEKGPRLSVFDRTGHWLRDEALPEPLRNAATQASEKDGIEALAWTAEAGFISTTEEPQLGQPRNVHRLYSGLADPAAFTDPGPESISLKAMETVDTRLFLLERTRHDETDALSPWLRIIDLPGCLAGGDCEGQRFPIPVAGITDADFEGLVALGEGLFLMVSDDRIDDDLRSVFVLFRVH